MMGEIEPLTSASVFASNGSNCTGLSRHIITIMDLLNAALRRPATGTDKGPYQKERSLVIPR